MKVSKRSKVSLDPMEADENIYDVSDITERQRDLMINAMDNQILKIAYGMFEMDDEDRAMIAELEAMILVLGGRR